MSLSDMRQDGFQVVGVPGGDPLEGKSCGAGFGSHAIDDTAGRPADLGRNERRRRSRHAVTDSIPAIHRLPPMLLSGACLGI